MSPSRPRRNEELGQVTEPLESVFSSGNQAEQHIWGPWGRACRAEQAGQCVWGPQLQELRETVGETAPARAAATLLSSLALTRVPLEKLVSGRNHASSSRKDSDVPRSASRCPREAEMRFPFCQTPGARGRCAVRWDVSAARAGSRGTGLQGRLLHGRTGEPPWELSQQLPGHWHRDFNFFFNEDQRCYQPPSEAQGLWGAEASFAGWGGPMSQLKRQISGGTLGDGASDTHAGDVG